MATTEDRNRTHTPARAGEIPADTFGTRLVLTRRHAGFLTVKEAAKRTGLDYGSWSNWERGSRPRDLLDVTRKIAEAFGVDEHWLLFGGPLTGSRGRPTGRPGAVTDRYAHTSLRMPANRSIGGYGLSPANARSDARVGTSRRARRITTQPAEADMLSAA